MGQLKNIFLGFAIALLICGRPNAEEVSYEDGVVVRVNLLDLRTDEGRNRIGNSISDAARTYCRALPPRITTVSACRRDIEAAMWSDLQDKAKAGLPRISGAASNSVGTRR